MHKQKQSKPPKRQQNTRSSSGMSEQLTLQQEKKRKFFIKEAIYTVYYLLRIALTIVLVLLFQQNFVEQLFDTAPFKRMQQNIALWKLDVISNITTVNSYNCPQGWQTYTSYQWPGIKQGCYCYAQLGQWDYIKVLQGSCNQLAMSAGCRKVDKMKAIPFLFWKKDELVCLKRVKGLNFFTSLDKQKVSKITCSSSTQYQIDIPSILNLSSCPITSITNTNQLPQQIKQINFSFSRATHYPIIMLRMTEYSFCADFSKENISPVKEKANNYNLQLKTRSYCDTIDSRVMEIDEIGEDQLFAANPRIMEAVKILPAYPQPLSDYRYKLGFVRYPQWKYSCRVSKQYDLYTAERHLNLEQMSAQVTLCTSLATVFIMLVGGLATLFYIFRKAQEFYYRHQQKVMYDSLAELQRKKPNLYQKLSKKFITQLIISLTIFLFALGLEIILAVLLEQLTSYFKWYKQAKSCTSQTMKEWLDLGYVKYFDKEQRNILLGIILVLALMIVDVGMFLWRNFKGDLKKQQLDEQLTNIFDEEHHTQDLRDQKQLDEKFNTYNHNQQQITRHQEIQLGETNHGRIVRNKVPEQINVTQESLIPMDYIQPSTIIRPKRPKRAKMLEPSEMSSATQQWDI